MRPPPGTYLTLGVKRSLPWAGVLFIALAFVSILTLWAMARTAPAWWRSISRKDPKTIAAAKAIEHDVTNRLWKDRKTSELDPAHERPGVEPVAAASEAWSFDVTVAQANAWLNCRMPSWVNNRGEEFTWPAEISELQVDFDNADIRIGVRVSAAGRDHVLTATLVPEVRADGSLWLTAKSVSIGRLGVPASWIVDRAEQTAFEYLPKNVTELPETRLLFRAFAGDKPIMSNAIVRLDGGRQVRIMRIVPKGGVLRVVCQTEDRADAGRRADAAPEPTDDGGLNPRR